MTITGPSRREIAKVLSRATVFALPSLSEGMPLTLSEMMSSGAAVVASTTSGIEEIVKNEFDGCSITQISLVMNDDCAARAVHARPQGINPSVLFSRVHHERCSMETKDRAQIRIILNHSPRTTLRMYEIADLLEEGWAHFFINKSAILCVAWAVMLWAEDEEDLIPLLSNIPTDKQQEIGLFCVENRFLPLLEQHVAPVTISADCYTWTLDKLLEEAPVLESLTAEDALFVNDHWDYKSEDSLGFIKHCIESMPSSCIRNEEGQPVAMAFCYVQSPYYVNMGGFKVLPEYRRQGLGKKVNLDICNKVLAQDRKPLIHVKIENSISQHICQSTNFKRQERVFWGEFDLEKQRVRRL